jgi:hypothetical protein
MAKISKEKNLIVLSDEDHTSDEINGLTTAATSKSNSSQGEGKKGKGKRKGGRVNNPQANSE